MMAGQSPARSPLSLYSVHPAVAYSRAILDNLPGKTGRCVEEWVVLLEREGPEGDERTRGDWLKSEHGLGGTTAAMILARAAGRGATDTDPEAYLVAAARWVEEMYQGAKASLRPIHDALVDVALGLGEDLRICPCKTIVPLYRNHVFAQIRPANRHRIDLGLHLPGTTVADGGRLHDTGGAGRGDRITHRVPLTSVAEVDGEVAGWLHRAYELDG